MLDPKVYHDLKIGLKFPAPRIFHHRLTYNPNIPDEFEEYYEVVTGKVFLEWDYNKIPKMIEIAGWQENLIACISLLELFGVPQACKSSISLAWNYIHEDNLKWGIREKAQGTALNQWEFAATKIPSRNVLQNDLWDDDRVAFGNPVTYAILNETEFEDYLIGLSAKNRKRLIDRIFCTLSCRFLESLE